MTLSKPPVMATRLLERSGASPELMGDLIEEYRHEHSRTWFWRQTMNIINRRVFAFSYVAFRWLAVAPLTILAIVAEFWVVVAVRAGGPVALLMSFVMAATFVKVGSWTAPSRKDSVARVALGIVTICGAFFAFMSPLLGLGFRPYEFWLGSCAVLGGTAASISSSPKLKPFLFQEIDLSCLEGLTRRRPLRT